MEEGGILRFLMPLYTRFGDTGDTMLYGGSTTSKTNPRIHAYGTVDELDAEIGVILAEDCPTALREKLLLIQRTLYRVKADLATPRDHLGKAVRIDDTDVQELERWIDEAEAHVPKLTHFILPGGTKIAALLHRARTVCRRAERWTVALARLEPINLVTIRYLNRLGDELFALARVSNHDAGKREEEMRADAL